MSDCPKSWESMSNPPTLRKLTDEEWSVLRGAIFPRDRFTYRVAADLVVLYAKAVGYEHEEKVIQCLKAVRLWDRSQEAPVASTEIYSFGNYSDVVDWRLGSPDWHSTKLSITPVYGDQSMLKAGIYTNVIDEIGLTERDIAVNMYFAKMARGYLNMAMQEV